MLLFVFSFSADGTQNDTTENDTTYKCPKISSDIKGRSLSSVLIFVSSFRGPVKIFISPT